MNASYDLGRATGVLGAMAGQANNKDESNVYFSRALVAMQNTIRLDSTFYDADLQIALIADQMGYLDLAEKHYKHYIQKVPNNLMAYTNLSYLYFRQKNFDQSLLVNRTAHQLQPQAPQPVMNIAKTYLNLDQTDSALEWMEKAYVMVPNDESLLKTLYELCKRKGDNERVQRYGKLLGLNK